MNLKYMKLALNEAEFAYNEGEIPIGAVIVKNDEIVAMAHNTKEKTACSVNHAEILAIIEASNKISNWRLEDCDIYVTLDPCPMCASALKQARIRNVYSALSNSDSNNYKILKMIFMSDNTNPSINFYSDLMCDESKMLLQKFFSERRK